jgi:MFS family permease
MRLRGITRNVFLLGLVSFFTDLATEMLYPLIPLFVTGVLGASPALLGLIDGIAEGISSGLRWIGGTLSDRWSKRRPFITAGYLVSALSKPIMGLAAFTGGWPLFLAGRSADRLGKSIRTAARDALIADSSEPQHRGLAFGFHRAMDTCGAIIGPLIALLILTLWPHLSLAWLFVIALVPGLISTLLTLTVRDITHPPDGHLPPLVQKYPPIFYGVLAAAAIFSIGNSSDSFLILRSKELGLSFTQVIIAYAMFNAVYAVLSAPLGKLSDHVGRKSVVIAGWMVYAVVYFGFAAARSAAAPWALLAAYGAYQALTEGVTKALIADVVDKRQRAGAIGLFYTVLGFGQLAASVIAGSLWNRRWLTLDANAGLLFGAACALIAALALLLVPLRKPTATPTL